MIIKYYSELPELKGKVFTSEKDLLDAEKKIGDENKEREATEKKLEAELESYNKLRDKLMKEYDEKVEEAGKIFEEIYDLNKKICEIKRFNKKNSVDIFDFFTF